MASPLVAKKLKGRDREPSLRTLKWSGIDLYSEIEKQVQELDENDGHALGSGSPHPQGNVSEIVSPRFAMARRILAQSPQPLVNTPSSSTAPQQSPAAKFAGTPSSRAARKKEQVHAVMDDMDEWRAQLTKELDLLRDHFRKREAELETQYAPLKRLSEALTACPDLAKRLEHIGKELQHSADMIGAKAYYKAASLYGNIDAQYVYGKNAGDYEALHKAASMGHPEAMLDLARMMEGGGQLKEAIKWYKEAEGRGNALAQMARITLQTRLAKEDERRRQSHLVFIGDEDGSDEDDELQRQQLDHDMMSGNP